MDPNRAEPGKLEEEERERSQDCDSTAGRRSAASFDAFYDFAFPRVYRFAQRHTTSVLEAEALCRLILVRALTSLGGLDALDDRVHRAPANLADLGFWLFCIARKTLHQVETNPDLLTAESVRGEEAVRVRPTGSLAVPASATSVSSSRARVPNR